jgi:hypothetical protein
VQIIWITFPGKGPWPGRKCCAFEAYILSKKKAPKKGELAVVYFEKKIKLYEISSALFKFS